MPFQPLHSTNMSNYHLSERSLARLTNIHPDLACVVKKAILLTEVDFTVLEGLRTPARQKELVASGASRTMKSRHLTGHAVDLGAYVGGEVRWDWSLYLKIAEAMRAASFAYGIPIRWGGTWDILRGAGPITTDMLSRSFPDGPHFELPAAVYP